MFNYRGILSLSLTSGDECSAKGEVIVPLCVSGEKACMILCERGVKLSGLSTLLVSPSFAWRVEFPVYNSASFSFLP